MEYLVGLALVVLGVGIGLVIALVLKRPKEELKVPEEKDAWKKLKEVSEERAKVKAKQKALHKAYAKHEIDEAAFVSKDAEYTHLIESYDKEIEGLLARIAYSYLPEELQKSKKVIREASDIGTLAKALRELKSENEELKKRIETLQVQMRELEEDKKRVLLKRNELEEELEKMDEELEFKDKKIEKLKKEKQKLEDRVAELVAETPEEVIENLKRENRLLRESLDEKNKKINRLSKSLGVLRAVLEKYAKLIEEKEAKTAEELKKLVQPNNPRVREIVKVYDTPKKVFEFVRDNIVEVSPNISATYWLTVDEMLRLRAADTEDESILLCSLLRALGEDAKVVVVELEGGLRKTLVAMNDRVLDPSIKSNFDDYTGLSVEEALKKYVFDGKFIKRILYEFNDKEYNSYQEGGE